MVAFRTDVAVVAQNALSQKPFWFKQSILTSDSLIGFVAEVINSDWQNDYARKKVEDYAILGTREYPTYVGEPKHPILSICTSVHVEYEMQPFRCNTTIWSQTFPELKSTAE